MDEDKYYDLMRYSWYRSNNGYVIGQVEGKLVYLSRHVMNYHGKLKIDHIDNNKLNNRLCNLRIFTILENAQLEQRAKEG